MIPSQPWFPTSLTNRVAWYLGFNTNIQVIGATLTLTPTDLIRIADDNAMMQFLGDSATLVNAYDDSVRSFRKIITEGEDGDPLPAFPANLALTPPDEGATGIFERLDDFVKRIKAAPAYTEATGELLGIIGSSAEGIAPGEVKPTIQLSAAVHDYLFSCVVSGRYDSDMWQVWAKPGGVENFFLLGTATGKSSDFTYEPGGEVPAPQALQVYVQLRRNNANYGQPSDIGLVTVNP